MRVVRQDSGERRGVGDAIFVDVRDRTGAGAAADEVETGVRQRRNSVEASRIGERFIGGLRGNCGAGVLVHV